MKLSEIGVGRFMRALLLRLDRIECYENALFVVVIFDVFTAIPQKPTEFCFLLIKAFEAFVVWSIFLRFIDRQK